MKTKTEAMKEYSESIKNHFDYSVESGHLTGFSAGWEACEIALNQEKENKEGIPEVLKGFLEEASDFFRGK